MELNLLRYYRNRTLTTQIDAYIEWKHKVAPVSAERERPPLMRFAAFVKVANVSEIEISHIREFELQIKKQLTTNYAEELALRSVRGLLRYYHARGHLCPSAKSVGKALQGMEYQARLAATT